MKKVEVHNFHNFTIENAKVVNHPLAKAIIKEKDVLTVVFIRDPYAYFDYLLFDYLAHKRSMLFTQDIINRMKKLNGEDFLLWFQTLNCIPFYNPQTFQLDMCKRVTIAIENLESFDYVVPYDEMDLFLEHVSPDIAIESQREDKLLFSLSTQKGNLLTEAFISKDIALYKRSVELWELVKKNNFKPLGFLLDRKRPEESLPLQEKQNLLHNYKGVAGQITSNSIVGWVFHIDSQEAVTVAIYKNDHFLYTLKADNAREDLKKRQIHPTGLCGFRVVFEKPTFKKGDKVEIKILPDMTMLPLSKSVKDFLQ